MVEAGTAALGTITAGEITTQDWPLIQQIRTQQQEVNLVERGLTNQVLLGTVSIVTPVAGSLDKTGISSVPDGAMETFTETLKEITNNIQTIGGNTLTQDQLFTMIVTGGHNKSIREFDKADVRGSEVIKDIKAAQSIIAGRGYLFSLDNIIDNPLFGNENERDMQTLAITTQLMPHLTSLGEDGKTVQISSRTLRPDMFPSSSMLLADAYLDQSYNQGWEGLDTNLYEAF